MTRYWSNITAIVVLNILHKNIVTSLGQHFSSLLLRMDTRTNMKKRSKQGVRLQYNAG